MNHSKDSTPSAGTTSRMVLLITLACLSGCCALAYEILYVRALTTVLGDMFYVHATLLSTFLIGIGIGAKVAHRWFRWLFLIEALTGLYALSLPWLLGWFVSIPGRSLLSSSPLLTILSTAGFLAVPSLLVGFSIPLFSGYLKGLSSGGLAFQKIYVVYNLGAVLSVLSVEFLLIRHLGVTSSLAVIGGANLVIGAALLLAGCVPRQPLKQVTRKFKRHKVIALALASLVSAIFQMFFLKLSYLVFEPHRENFAVAISVTLLGILIGACWAARTSARFGTLMALLPLVLGVIYSLYLPIVRLHASTEHLVAQSDLLILSHKFLFGCLFALGPMIIFGAILPALMRSENDVTLESGHLLFISSIANAGGYLAYVLVGHPYLETSVLLLLIGLTALLASLLATEFRWTLKHAILALLGLAALLNMVAAWDERELYLAQWLERLRPEYDVEIFKSGAESATLLTTPQYEWVSYNGHPSIFVKINGVINRAEVISGVIPALVSPRLDRALVLGLGTGITAGTVAQSFESTEIVEINKAFLKMMPRLRDANFDLESNPSGELFLADGRAFLVGKKESYDVILNSIPAPTYFAASKIYTVEFYQLVRQALKPDGVFCTWLAPPNMSEEGVRLVLSALSKSFSYCDLRILSPGYYMAACSNSPITTRKFSDLVAGSNLVTQLRHGLPGYDLDEFFEDIRLSKDLLAAAHLQVSRENTDDDPVLEFELVRSYQRGQLGYDLFIQQPEDFTIDPVRNVDGLDPARLAQRARVYYELGPEFFRIYFLPLLRQRPDLWEAWNGR